MTPDIPDVHGRLLDALTTIVSDAGAAILAARAGSLDARSKADHSPVTAADHAAEAVILAGLARVLPCGGRGTAAKPCPRACPTFIPWISLDGTRELVGWPASSPSMSRSASDGRSLVGAPAQGLIWRGIEGQGAERPASAGAPRRRGADGNPEPAWPARPDRAVRSHPTPGQSSWRGRRSANGLPAGRRPLASSPRARPYPRLSPTCEYQRHHVVLTAGRRADGLMKQAPRRVVQDFRIPAFVAWGTHRQRLAGAGRQRELHLRPLCCPGRDQ